MKVWEVMRKPRLVVRPDTPATVVRAEMRYREEPIAVIAEDPEGEKFAGFITPREIIQITSHYSNLRAKDLALDYPVLKPDMDLKEAFELMREHGVWGAPVVDDNNRILGVVTIFDMLNALLKAGIEPVAETVAEVQTEKDLDLYVTTPDERIDKVWHDFIARNVPGKVVVRSKEEPVPVGLITPWQFVETSRWFFHRESERGLKSVAKVKRIMIRGTPVATPETPVQYVAKVMAENEFSILPVVDEDGRLRAVVTMYDALRAYVEGAKPGRKRPVKKAALPIAPPEEVKLHYMGTESLLQQVAAAKPAEKAVKVTAAQIARKQLPAITVNDTVEHARREMLRTRSNYLLVVDEKGNIVGVVSKWSMLRAIALKGPIWKRRVHDRYFIDYVMETNIPRVPANATIDEVAYAMVNSRAEVAFVTDEKGSIVGFITKDDLVRAYKEYYAAREKVENLYIPGKVGVVHPHHSLYHAVKRMKTFYLDALTVADGTNIQGVISANRLPFVAYEDAVEGIKSRRLIWVRKLVRGGPKKGRYVKVTPLLAIDATVRLPADARVTPQDSVLKAIELMEKYNVDGVPVVDEEGAPLGVICKNDIVRSLARIAQERKAREAVVEEGRATEQEAKTPQA